MDFIYPFLLSSAYYLMNNKVKIGKIKHINIKNQCLLSLNILFFIL